MTLGRAVMLALLTGAGALAHSAAALVGSLSPEHRAAFGHSINGGRNRHPSGRRRRKGKGSIKHARHQRA